ncbi:hypothetical protein GCM10020358_75560 [Amorphoplanes nipponensis]|uniref:Uncharacterized protein n=2 Tax=Actinoplanes nipponensis TaxID=135950 RepID=A0A919JGJ6_9ACTN|nr:hypothetical protein Ani05nite_36150 [Actinoplanes nipponensis]
MRGRAGAAVRGVLGAVSLVGGLTWILLNLAAPRPVTDMIVGLVLTAGGLVLLMPHRVPLPGRATAAATLVAGVGGTLAGLVAQGAQLGGMWVYLVTRGWPSAWLSRAGLGGDPATARQVAEQSGWQVDVVNLAADLYFWAVAGLLVVAAAGVARRAARIPQATLQP